MVCNLSEGGYKDTKPATFSEEGESTRTCRLDHSHKQTRPIPKPGHVHNTIYVEKVEASLVIPIDPANHTGERKIVGEKAAGCETEGYSVDVRCGDCDLLLSAGIKYEPTGHNYGPPIYTWGSDMKSCTAEMVCLNDNTHVIKETVHVTSAVKTAPTVDAKGVTVYIAEFTNKTFTTQVRDVDDIPMISEADNTISSDNGGISPGKTVTDRSSDALYEIASEGTTSTVTYNTSTVTNISNVTIPDTVIIKGRKYKVTSIKAGAFKNNKKLKEYKKILKSRGIKGKKQKIVK